LEAHAKRWIRTRKQILQQVKEQISDRLGLPAKELEDYSKEYKREFAGKWKTSSWPELYKSLTESQIIYMSDFHAYAQAQRVVLRILRELPEDIPVVLALECFESRHQEQINKYLEDRWGIPHFLRETNWRERWSFPFENYQPVVELAKVREYPVYGLNKHYARRTANSLHKRDQHAAKCLQRIAKKHPDSLIIVVFGEWHLAKEHLPGEFNKLLGKKKLKQMVIHQNSEKIYFQLAKQGKEMETEVVTLGRGKYCVLSSPPWVKWQSYLLHLDRVIDKDLDDFEDHYDFSDHFLRLLNLICKDLKIEAPSPDVSVYGPGASQVWYSLSRYLNKNELRIAERLMRDNKSFYVPQGRIFYLGQATVNQAADLAGQYLHAHLSQRERLLWDFPGDFHAAIFVAGMGFFCSKLVNHKRKNESIMTLRARLSQSHREAVEAMRLALDFKTHEFLAVYGSPEAKGWDKPRRRSSYLEAASILGSMLGERVYFDWRKGLIDAVEIKDLLSQDVTKPEFRQTYYGLVRRIELPWE
jgi:uncharacterized iron-regulated protein